MARADFPHMDLVVERYSTNKLAKVDEQRKEIASAANNHSSCPDVVGKASKMTGPVEEVDDKGVIRQRYTFTVRLEKKKFKTEASALKALEAGRKFVTRMAESRGWAMKGEVADVKEQQANLDSKPAFTLPALTPDVMKKYFRGIKERDAHIRLMYASIYNYKSTCGEDRNHTLLYGDPASAKSSLIKCFKNWFEEDGVERITMINATTLSKAGLENWLLEKARIKMLPEILWINELEKGNPDDFLCLLTIMDQQGEIQRLNSRIGKQQEAAKVLIWADCNDEQKIRNWNKEALWSRFNKRWACVRPSRDVMLEILIDNINERKQKGYPSHPGWAKAALDYAYDVMKCDDPREILGLLDGGDKLLDGSYFKDMELVKAAYEVKEKQKLLKLFNK